MSQIRRIYVEKKNSFDGAAQNILRDLAEVLDIPSLTGVRRLIRYDIDGLTDDEYHSVLNTVLSEPPVDMIYEEDFPLSADENAIALAYLPGQYDQRADSAAQCIQLTTLKAKPALVTAEIIVLRGELSETEISRIKKYLINPVDSQETTFTKPDALDTEAIIPADVAVLEGFITLGLPELQELWQQMRLAMDFQDLLFCRDYFRDTERRNPTVTEIKMLDTYWSDHCRHTTFNTLVTDVEIEDAPLTAPVKESFNSFMEAFHAYYPDRGDDISLMNLATMSMKQLRAEGLLADLEESGEINACSIIRDVLVDGQKEKWLVMFKNETHNHPTEIEPFGGAATCLGGAIRDPLSGRAFVYQAMRVTGCGDPNRPVQETPAGKLPQRKITTEAAHGYSSYGNQIGLATGQVSEIYHPGYVAKRMEVGAVIGAVPQKNVIREEPAPGDIILLVGGRTGRDGIGGATGSSRGHTEESIHTAGAEVQKGNAPEERKLQRLFRSPHVCRLIRKCNDFGAGGISVAIGELAEGLEIILDKVPKKYEGLDGTELALSESQERMAAVVKPQDVDAFIRLASAENLEATSVACVTGSKRLKMTWRGKTIVDIARSFIDTNGVRQRASVRVPAPDNNKNFFLNTPCPNEDSLLEKIWLATLSDLNHCGQRGLSERFDSTVGAGTVLLPFGGKHQLTPVEAMAAKIPTLSGNTLTCSLMSHGFNPWLSSWSPFHGAVYAIIEAAAKIVACGGDFSTIRFSLQEYFEKPGNNPERWGKPFSALLGAYHALIKLQIPAIGGKDSMSGSFGELDVPPTLIAFAATTMDVRNTISPEFEKPGDTVIYLEMPWDEHFMPDFNWIHNVYPIITRKIKEGAILAARSVRSGGLAAAISEMTFGNKTGFRFNPDFPAASLFTPAYGSLILEVAPNQDLTAWSQELPFRILGQTLDTPVIHFNTLELPLDRLIAAWEETLEGIFPTQTPERGIVKEVSGYSRRSQNRPALKIAKPRVLITAFPGTNCEYDTHMAFERAGAEVETFVFRNLSPSHIAESIATLRQKIDNCQIIAIPGGFSSGDEPDGSGKFITAVFRNPHVAEIMEELLKRRDGLMIGICNGFQALVKLGLLPFGEIRAMTEKSPTLTFNRIGRHVSHIVHTRVASVLSPWFIHMDVGDIHSVAVSHGEGRFIADEDMLRKLITNGQIATQYVDHDGVPTMEFPYNPNGSVYAVEGLTSPDGRILGKMAHMERMSTYTYKNIPGNKVMKIFQSGVDYFS